MRFACASVDLAFFDKAPWRFVNTVELDWSPARVFATFEDGDAWPKWFKSIQKVVWTTPRPFGVGTTRTVTLSSLTADELFIRWEAGRRFSFHFTGATVPIFRALAEDYLLEPLAGGRTRFTYTVAVDPGLLLRLTAPIGRPVFEAMFKGAAQGLQAFCSGQQSA